MKLKVKICGITTLEDIKTVNSCKPDFAGFVMFFPKSKRNVSARIAEMLLKALDKSISSVAVTVSPTADQVRLIKKIGFDYIQIHGQTDESVYSTAEIKVLRAFNVSDIPLFARYSSNPNIVGYVFDAHEPGSGKTFDWNLLKTLPRDGKLFILAGGLTPETVQRAVAAVEPDGVDVSSGVENEDGSGKNFEKVRAFISNARK